MTEERSLLLTENQYVHVLDRNSGQVRLIEGAYRGTLGANEEIFIDVTEKVNLVSNEYAIIVNPIVEGEQKFGERTVRKGPAVFSLHPFQVVHGSVRQAISLADNQAVYVLDTVSGKVKLEAGPKELFLGPYEELYNKTMTEVELRALNLPLNYPTDEAVRVELDEGEVIQLIDDDGIRIEMGPKTIFLGPFEFAKYVNLSGSTPKRPGQIRTGIIRLGPDFLSDILTVRTRDNASLQIFIRYKWRFNADPEQMDQLFIIRDFIGYAAENLGSEIREAASRHDFEDFHSDASAIVKRRVFGDANSRTFENGFEIFSVDIREISPVDADIAEKLNAAISNNMDVYVKKIQQNAKLDATRQEIRGEKVLEEQRAELIELKNRNLRQQETESARIAAEAQLEMARKEAETELARHRAENQIVVQQMRETIDLLNQEGGDKFLKLMEQKKLSRVTEATIVPKDARLLIPMREAKDHAFDELESLDGLESLFG